MISWLKSFILVASAAITLEPVFAAKASIVPIRRATGVLVSTKTPPASATDSAVFQAIDLSSKAPKIIPFLPSNILCDIYLILEFKDTFNSLTVSHGQLQLE